MGKWYEVISVVLTDTRDHSRVVHIVINLPKHCKQIKCVLYVPHDLQRN